VQVFTQLEVAGDLGQGLAAYQAGTHAAEFAFVGVR